MSGTSAFRPDIEGLRAIAILAVIACHAELPYLQGGFVGVDIFFVISGYLITGLLAREYSTSGKIDLLDFYARRLKRLFPALALMIVATSIAAAVLLPSSEQLQQAEAATAALFWLSNMYYAAFDAGYFESGVENNLFLHTWSLGVEEQFYLVWPLLVLLLLRRLKLLHGLLVVFVVCLVCSLVLSYSLPVWAFYAMPSRGWQFALGGIVYVFSAGMAETASAPARRLAGIGGLLLLAASILLFHEDMTYPGLAALIPTCGAALLLLARVNWLAGTLLRETGKLSYSWYLWHWPVFILAETVFQRNDIGFKVAAISASLALAILAYRFVEDPVRHSVTLSARPRITMVYSAVAMLLGALLAQVWAREGANSPSRDALVQYEARRRDMPAPYDDGCDTYLDDAALDPCIYGNTRAPRTAVLMGDSIGTQWFSALGFYARDGWRLVVLTKSSCPIVDQPVFNPRIKARFFVCESWRSKALEYVTDLKPDVVLMGSSSGYGYSHEEWKGGTERVLSMLSAASSTVYIIQSTPAVEQEPAGHARALDAVAQAAEGFDNVKVLDLNALVCPRGICNPENFRDGVHIKDTFVQSLSQAVMQSIAAAD